MKAGGAAPSRCRCSSTLGRVLTLIENSAPAPATARPDGRRSMAATSAKATWPERPGAGAGDQHRHPFAGVIGAAPGRVIAVIGGEDRQIAGPAAGPESARRGHRTIPARGHSPPRRGGGRRGCRTRQSWQRSRNRARPSLDSGQQMIEKVKHRPCPCAAFRCPASRRCRRSCRSHGSRARRPAAQSSRVGAGGGDGVVVAVGGAAERARRAGEGPGDDPADLHRVQHAARAPDRGQQPVEPEGLLMRRDLEDAVGRGVADRPAGAHDARRRGAR